MSRSSLYGVLTAILSILLVTLSLGQGCSGGDSPFGSAFGARPTATKLPGTSIYVGNGNGGGYSGMDDSGNGGGYSGLQSLNRGGYYSSSFNSHSDDDKDGRGGRRERQSFQGLRGMLLAPSDFFALVQENKNCGAYLPGWNLVGPSINGLIAVDDREQITRAQYLSSACLGAIVNSRSISPASLQILDFDRSTLIYGDQIYQAIAEAPPQLANLTTARGYCRSDISVVANGAQVGMSVKVYLKNGRLLGDINVGRLVGNRTMRFSVDALALDESSTETELRFETTDFLLQISKASSRPASGLLDITLDGQALSLPMSCWY